MDFLVGLFLGWCLVVAVCVLTGAYVRAEKNRPVSEGVIFGLILGPIGVLIAAVLPTLPASPSRSETTPRPTRTVDKIRDEEADASAWLATVAPATPERPADPIEADIHDFLGTLSSAAEKRREPRAP